VARPSGQAAMTSREGMPRTDEISRLIYKYGNANDAESAFTWRDLAYEEIAKLERELSTAHQECADKSTALLHVGNKLAAAESARREAVRKCAEICEQPSGQGVSSGTIDIGKRCNDVLYDRARQIRAAFPADFVEEKGK
jgi:hypothetical protein